MTAARSDLTALADELRDISNHTKTLPYKIISLRLDKVAAALRLAASQPDREAIARALARAQSPTALTAYDAGAGLAVSYWNMQADTILSLLSGAGTKSLALAIDSLFSGEHKNEADSNRTND